MTHNTADIHARGGSLHTSQALVTDDIRRKSTYVSYLICLASAISGLVSNVGPNPTPTVWFPSSSLLSPAGSAGLMWLLALIGMGVHVFWMWLPTNAGEDLTKASYTTSVALALIGIWFLSVRGGAFFIATLVSVAIIAALIRTLILTGKAPHRGFLSRHLNVFGPAVTLGWMSILAAVTLSATVESLHLHRVLISAETWGILATTGLLGLGMALLHYLPGRLYIAISMAWGFLWIAHARVRLAPRAYGLGLVAIGCAFLVCVANIAVVLSERSLARERVS